MASKVRAVFGANKYAALHLLMARWIRLHAWDKPYHYVTLGGTELADVRSLAFIGRHLVSGAVSYEERVDRSGPAGTSAGSLQGILDVASIHGDIFEYEREDEDERPHLVFVDLERVCGIAEYAERFQRFFQNGTLRAGDGLLITSYLGRNPGWARMLRPYEPEFRILGVSGEMNQIWWYRKAHPAFALYRGLRAAGLDTQVQLESVGSILYTDTSAMGLYGYALSPGPTRLRSLAHDGPYLRLRKGFVEAPPQMAVGPK